MNPPKCSDEDYINFLIATPREILHNGNAIKFGFKFQKENADNEIDDYGTDILLRFGEADLPKE